MKIHKRYSCFGFVVGNCWGGGTAAFKSYSLETDTLKDLEKKIKKGIEDGSLDSGMGFESLIGGIFSIKTDKSLFYKNEWYHSNKYRIRYFGKLSRKLRRSLKEQLILYFKKEK